MSELHPVIEPELIPYGMKAALVCLDDGPWRDGTKAYFTEHGYYLMDEPDPAISAAKLKLNSVDVVVTEATKTETLQEINSRPGLKRRETTLFVVGAQPSMDAWTAFQSGVDWVLNTADASRCAELLTEALKRQEAQREPWRLAQG